MRIRALSRVVNILHPILINVLIYWYINTLHKKCWCGNIRIYIYLNILMYQYGPSNSFFGSASAWSIPALVCSQTHLHWMLRGETVEFYVLSILKCAWLLSEVSGCPGSWSVAVIFSLQMVSGRCGAMSVHWGWNTEDWNLHDHWPLLQKKHVNDVVWIFSPKSLHMLLCVGLWVPMCVGSFLWSWT